jgi:hypothetical protein
MFGRVSKQKVASTALNPSGVSLGVREIAPRHLHQGAAGAIAVGTPTERSGARSHPVAYSRGAHRSSQSDLGCINEGNQRSGLKDEVFGEANDMVMPVSLRVRRFRS